MKVVVTGGTGFVGSHAVEALCRAGHEIRLFARSREKVDRVFEMRGVEVDDVVLGDMTDAESCRQALVGCEAVVHTAASVEIGNTRDVFSSNVDGIHNVVGAAVELGLDPIVYVSSIARGVSVLSLDGTLLSRWGERRLTDMMPWPWGGHHSICVDSQGNIYTAEVPTTSIYKFARR